MSAETFTPTGAYNKAQAKAHDAELAAATNVLRAAMDREDSANNDIHRAAGDKTGYYHGRRHATWGLNLDEAIATARQVAAGHLETLGERAACNLRNAPQRAAAALQARDSAVTDIATARAAIEELEQVWRDNGRWSRFFMVPGGHIHRSTACHSLHISTQISWLPELSGESEAEAVNTYGTVLCTHCFPSAPVEWTTKAPKPADPNECPGSRKYVPGANMRLCSPRGTCPECGQTVSVTSRGNARKH
uniref:Uncharacterized protein n=2 Tax=unclassified Mycobacterium TaxID=2642494 RepID=A0A5Q5BT35_MYCSS